MHHVLHNVLSVVFCLDIVSVYCFFFFFSQQKLNCQWQKTGQFVLEAIVHNLAWNPTGTLIHIVLKQLNLLSICGNSGCFFRYQSLNRLKLSSVVVSC